jgi:hypothetical protein
VALILDEVKAGWSAPPLLNALHTRMIGSVSQVDEESNLAAVFDCAQDARLEIDNTIAERSISYDRKWKAQLFILRIRRRWRSGGDYL